MRDIDLLLCLQFSLAAQTSSFICSLHVHSGALKSIVCWCWSVFGTCQEWATYFVCRDVPTPLSYIKWSGVSHTLCLSGLGWWWRFLTFTQIVKPYKPYMAWFPAALFNRPTCLTRHFLTYPSLTCPSCVTVIHSQWSLRDVARKCVMMCISVTLQAKRLCVEVLIMSCSAAALLLLVLLGFFFLSHSCFHIHSDVSVATSFT